MGLRELVVEYAFADYSKEHYEKNLAGGWLKWNVPPLNNEAVDCVSCEALHD